MNSFNSRNSTNPLNNDDDDDVQFGFQRPEMYKTPLAGTVDPYDRHVFLCFRNPQNWPASVEDPSFDPLPRLLAAALKSRKNQILRKIRLTLCEGGDDNEFSNGDVLIFPDMIRYRGLTHLDVDSFVDHVFVRSSQWASGVPERLTGSYVFVCCHQNRDRRCGSCGPVLVNKFKEVIELQTMKHQVFVSPCSHLGGHQYAGNLIIFGQGLEGNYDGHWYGYVTPADVPVLLDDHIAKGKIVERLWRGQMCLANGEGNEFKQTELHNLTINENVENERESSAGSSNTSKAKNGATCCCSTDGVSCCGNNMVEEKAGGGEKNSRASTRTRGLGRL